ncbi:MAG: sigma 54-interacting transcriptional regulator [Candidatus Scalindua sp.]|nr:sigma 54-interacting transcriptional regulator [Candidatus Scalindua sp.]
MDIEFLQSIALSVANEQSAKVVFSKIVKGLADDSNIVLARIWLIEPGDICDNCSKRKSCSNQSKCLHLVASDGSSIQSKDKRSVSIDGNYRRFPLHTTKSNKLASLGKIGFIAGSGNALLFNNIDRNTEWLRDPEWAKNENVTSFAGQPLIFRKEVLGVLAIFSRTVLDESYLKLLRTFADNAAAAISNARAFEKIEQLHRQLELENEYLRDEVREEYSFDKIIGQSTTLQNVFQQIALVAPTDATVLINGESGTGKELIALSIHQRSKRNKHPLIKVNCASIPRELFESEFFGHVKGAFTGAIKDRIGRFQLADGGTLFLDEVGEIPIEMQSKLLRVLQEGEYERIGDEKTCRVNVRIIAATNRDLKKDVESKEFREDLYFRLNVFPLEIAPLRSRNEDIPLLAKHFLDQSCRRLGISQLQLKKKHVLQLQNYNWPGNIRELQNIIERGAILSMGKELWLDLTESAALNPSQTVRNLNDDDNSYTEKIITYPGLKQLEKDNIVAALNKSGWRVGGAGGAAEILETKPTTLASRMKALGVQKET